MKLLYITNIAIKVGTFSSASISAAHSLGIDLHLAARWLASSEQIEEEQSLHDIKIHNLNLVRSPFSLRNFKAYKELIRIIKDEKIDAIHCNTPIGGILGRICGRALGVKKVIYQAHGFHFYKGAPKKNWLLYYPVEKLLARYTDALITINQEDYELAKRKISLRRGGKVYYVPGVGIDLDLFSAPPEKNVSKRDSKREELGIPQDAVLLLSVGELNGNKNHETIIRAIANIIESPVYYVIAGKGELHNRLQGLIDSLGLKDRVQLLGYRNDIRELYRAADIFVFPSFREGLSISLMEAMASGLPCVVSRIRGNTDLLTEGKGGFLCRSDDIGDFTEKLSLLISNGELRLRMGQNNLTAIQNFGLKTVTKEMRNIYASELYSEKSEESFPLNV